MMTNKFVLIALILCVSSSVNSLKLGNLCKQDCGEYIDLEVNSFYKIPTQVSLDSNESLAMLYQKLIFFYPPVHFSKHWFTLF